MNQQHIAALTLLGWALIITEPSPRTIKTGFTTKEACEKAADSWRASYKQHLKQARATTYPNRRRRITRAIPPTKCVETSDIPAAHP